MKTYSAKPQEIEKTWHIIDAKGQVLGRIATATAKLLRGKHKPQFTPHIDTGDYVVIINAEKVILTGNKEIEKIYTRYTGYVGNQKIETPQKIRARKPQLLLEKAIKGMLPHNRLGAAQFGKLKIYAGENHPHQGQEPKKYQIIK